MSVKHVSLAKATRDEARKRIDAVLQPYIDNMHPVYEAGTVATIKEVRGQLYGEFDDFGFDYVDLMETGNS